MHRVFSSSSGFLFAAFAVVLLAAGSASAQEAGQPPPPPPPGYAPSPQGPPPGYGAPPPGYGAPPPGYGYGVPGQPYPGYPPQALGPKTMDYEEGDPIPPGYRTRTHIRKGMVIGGAVTFGAVYIFTLLTAAVGDSVCSGGNERNCDDGTTHGYRWLYVPVVGPFVAIGQFGSTGGGTAALVIDGVAQAGGVALFIAGLVADQTELVRNDLSKKTKPHMFVVPTVAQGSSGLGVVGTF